MTRDEIEAFVCIAESGGFTQASLRLRRSQPAISRRIRQLEDALGAALFERAGRGVKLSAAGHALLPHAEAALASLRDGARAVRDASTAAAEQALSIAIVGTLADSHIVDALRALEAEFPQASVELRTANSKGVSALVRAGEATLGLRYFADDNEQLESTSLGAERLFAIVPKSHSIRGESIRSLRSLADETWLSFPLERRRRDSYAGILLDALERAGVEKPSITTIDSLTAQKRLIEAGLGVALMPLSSVREEIRIGSLRKLDVRGLKAELPVVAVSRRGGHPSPLADAFIRLVRKRLRSA